MKVLISNLDISKSDWLILAGGIGLGAVIIFSGISSILILAALIIVLLVVLFLHITNRNAFLALSIVLLLMPFHTIVDNALSLATNSESIHIAFSLWKELSLFVIGLFLLSKKVLKKEIIAPTREMIVFGFYAAWGIIFIFTANSNQIGVLEYRNIYEGILILLVLWLLRPPLEKVLQLFNWMILEGVLISIWGIISRYVLDFYHYLMTFGFITPDVTPAILQYRSVFAISGNLFLRANSIFSGPNEFGLYLATLIVPLCAILLFKIHELTRRQKLLYILALIALGTGELITISRNSWILITVALIVIFFSTRGSKRKLQIFVAACSLLTIMLIAVPNLWNFTLRTIRLEDTSAAGRTVLLDEGINAFLQHPMGIGMGNASYKIEQINSNYLHTEFYLFIIGLELGWIGLFLYLLTIAVITRKCFKLSKPNHTDGQRIMAVASMALLIGTFASQFTAAISMEWIFQIYLWFFVGVTLFPPRSNYLMSYKTKESTIG